MAIQLLVCMKDYGDTVVCVREGHDNTVVGVHEGPCLQLLVCMKDHGDTVVGVHEGLW